MTVNRRTRRVRGLVGLLLLGAAVVGGAVRAGVTEAGGPYAGREAQPILLVGAYTPTTSTATFAWQFGDGTTGQGYAPLHAYATAGTHTATLTVTDGAQTFTDTATVTVVAGPAVVCVPWQYSGGLEVAHDGLAGATKPVRLKATVFSKTFPVTYTWDFGDGATSSGSAASAAVARSLEVTHAYTLPGGVSQKPFVATLTATAGGLTSSDTYLVRVYATTSLEVDTNIAIDEALWYTHKNQIRTAGGTFGAWYCIGNGEGFYPCSTASALQAMQINGHGLLSDPAEDPYAYDVRLGFDYLFTSLRTKAIAAQTYVPDPDFNDNGVGIEVTSSHPIYEGGQAMDAICSSHLPDFRAYTGPAGVTGRTFKDIVQDMVDMYAWGQTDSGNPVGGGWQYSWNSGSDNSAAQWGAIGMQAAEDVFGCTVADGVKARNMVWLSYSYQNTMSSRSGEEAGFEYGGEATRAFGYTGSGTGVARNASGLVQMAWNNMPTTHAYWTTTENWYTYSNRWTTWFSASEPNYYAAYAFTKAMRLAKPNPVVRLAQTNVDWYGDTTTGLARRLCGMQQTDGSWYGTGSPTYGYVNTGLATPWGVIMLTRTLFVRPPVADAGPDVTWAKSQPLWLDASQSFHLDPARYIAKYEWILAGTVNTSENFHYTGVRRAAGRAVVYDWDIDEDGVADLTTDTPSIQHAWTLASVNVNTPYIVTLRVTDDAVSPQTDEDTKSVLIIDGATPPTASPGGPYTATAGLPVRLSGRASTDTDPGDYITRYAWDLDGNAGTYERDGGPSTAAEFDWTFTTAGSFVVALTVWDNGVGGTQLNSTAYATVVVRANQAPAPVIGGPYQTVEGQAVTLDASRSTDANGDPLSFAWDLDNDGAFDDATGPTATFLRSSQDRLAPNAYTVGVRVGDGVATASAQTTVTVSDKAPVADFVVVPSSPKEGERVEFRNRCTSSPDALAGYAWDFGDGVRGTSTAANPAYTYAANGTYTVSLAVTDSDGSTTTVQKTLTVRDTAPTASFTFSPVNPTLEGAQADTGPVTFTDTSTVGVDAVTGWLWTFPDASTADTATAAYAFTAAGAFPVSLRVTDADGSTATVTRQVVVTAPSDLTVQTITFSPDPLLQGTRARFDAVVRNGGRGNITGSFLVDFRVTTTTREDVSIGTVTLNGLASGQAKTATLYWPVPAGTHQLWVDADSGEVVSEENEDNNSATLALGTVGKPDLGLAAVGVEPAAPVQGETVRLVATVSNPGPGATALPVKVRFSVGDTPVGDAERPQGLGVGETAVLAVNWVVPDGAARTVTVVVDPDGTVAEADEGNNAGQTTIPEVGQPNLVPGAISWSPQEVSHGQRTSLNVVVANTGAGTRRPVRVRVLVDDVAVGTVDLAAGLGSGAQGVATVTWQATVGEHVLEAIVDPDLQVVETNENDNRSAAPTLLSIGSADLVITQLTAVPAAPVQGSQVQLLARVANQGTAATRANFAVQFFIDTRVVATAYVTGGLAAGADAVVPATWTATAGEHTFGAAADATNLVDEAAAEGNNAMEVVLGAAAAPDFQVSALTLTPAEPVQGEAVTVRATVTNAGGSTLLPFAVTFAANGQTIGRADVRGGLAAGASQELQATWTALAGNGHQVSATADSGGVVPESNEGNNVRVQNVPAVVPPDLTVLALAYAPEAPAQGDEVTIEATVTNAHVAAEGKPREGTTLQPILVRFEIDGQVLATATLNGGLAAGASAPVTATWSAVAGQHRVTARVDPANVILESTETNNARSQDMQFVPYPDLSVTGATYAPRFPGSGSLVTFTVTVQNTGGPALQTFHVGFLADGVDAGEQPVLGGLAAGGQITVSFAWRAVAGTHSFTFVADSRNVILEADEAGRAGRGNQYTTEIVDIPPAPVFAALSLPSTATPWSGILGQGGRADEDVLDPISWEASSPAELEVTVSLFAVRGSEVIPICLRQPAVGSFGWNTMYAANGARVADGSYQIRARAEDSLGGYVEVTQGPATICNTPVARLTAQSQRAAALTGEVREYQVTLTNWQPAPADYTLSFPGLPAGLTADLSATTVHTGKWASATFSVQLTATAAGDRTAVLHAAETFLRDAQTPLAADLQLTLAAKDPLEIAATPAAVQVSMGGTQDVQLALVNNQGVDDVLGLQVAGVPPAWVSLPTSVALAAGARTAVTLSLGGLDQQGVFPVTVTATSRNRDQSVAATVSLTTVPEPFLSDLRPADGTRFGARRVTIRWVTSVVATTEVYYRGEALPTREGEYLAVTGEPGTVHQVVLEDLARNHRFHFYVRSESQYGSAQSEERSFIVDNGIVFTDATYALTANRDYGTQANIGIYNSDAFPHEVFLTVRDVPEELAVGFVGAGHDTRLMVPPATYASVQLGIFTQDAIAEAYTLNLHLDTRDADPVTDDAVLNLNVHFPITDFDLAVVGQDPVTLGRKVRLTNLGDPVTDFRVEPGADLAGAVTFAPMVTHAYLQTGESLDFWVYPTISDGFESLAGSVFAYGSTECRELALDFSLPEGTAFYWRNANDVAIEEGEDPASDVLVSVREASDDRYVIRFHLEGTEETDYVEMTFQWLPLTVDQEPSAEDIASSLYQVYSPVFNATGGRPDFHGELNAIVARTRPGAAAPARRGVGDQISYGYEVCMFGYDTYNTQTAQQIVGGFDARVNPTTVMRRGLAWNDYVDKNPGISDDLKPAVKLFDTLLGGGRRLVSKVPGAGPMLSDMIGMAQGTFENAIKIFSRHNQELDEVLDAIEGRADGHDWYCTNRPVVDSEIGLPPWIDPANVSDAEVGIRITPNLAGTVVGAHDLQVSLNGNPLAPTLTNDVHSGLFHFRANPAYINFSGGLQPAANRITIRSFNFNPGHYASAYDFFLSVTMSNATLPFVAGSSAEADQQLVDWWNQHRIRPDFAVFSEDLIYSEASVGAGALTVRVNNLGSATDLTLATVKVDGQVIDQRWLFVSAFSRQAFALPWTATAQHTVSCELWARSIERRTDNNTASRTVGVAARDTDGDGPIVSQTFPAADSLLFTNDARVGASYRDASGIDASSVSLRLDGALLPSAVVTADQVWYQPAPDTRALLAEGTHTVEVRVSDTAGNATTEAWSFTVNTQAPAVYNVEATQVTQTGALIVWQTNVPADSLVLFGTDATRLTFQKFADARVTLHEIQLGGLTPGTQYYYKVLSTKADGLSTWAGTFSFFTGGNRPPLVPDSPVPADGATDVTAAPLLSWTSGDPDALDTVAYDVYLGTDPNPTVRVAAGLSTASLESVPLAYATRCFWRVVARDARGAVVTGNVWTFVTRAAVDVPPALSDLQVTVTGAGGRGAGVEARVGDTVTVSFTATEALYDLTVRIGMDAFERLLEGGGSRDETYEFSYTVAAGDPPGTYPVIIRGVDADGNLLYDDSREVIITDMAPVAGFYALPLGGVTPVTVAFFDASTGGTPTEWTWDFGDSTGGSSAQNPSHTYNDPGVYTVSLTVANAAGSDLMMRWYYVDGLAPTLQVPTQAYNTGTPTVWVVADDYPSGPSSVSVTINGKTYLLEPADPGVQRGSYEGTVWQATIPTEDTLAEGLYDITATAVDAVGISTIVTGTDALIIDWLPPVVALGPPVPVLSGSATPLLTGTVDASTAGLVSLSVTLNGKTYEATVASDRPSAGQAWSVLVPPEDALPPGVYTLVATANDAAGNTTEQTFTDGLIVDLSGPQVTVSPSETSDTTPPLSGRVTDAGGSGVVSLEVRVGSWTFTYPGPVSFEDSLWSLPDGLLGPLSEAVYDVQVTARDGAGNASSDATTGELTVYGLVTLTVTSAYGTAQPPAGTHTYRRGTSVTAGLPVHPVAGTSGQRFSLTGWTGTGSLATSGSGDSTGPVALTQDSTLTWLWQTEWQVSSDTLGIGSVDIQYDEVRGKAKPVRNSADWYADGAGLRFTATSVYSEYPFLYWYLEPGGLATSNPLHLTVQEAVNVRAVFGVPAPLEGLHAAYPAPGTTDVPLYDALEATIDQAPTPLEAVGPVDAYEPRVKTVSRTAEQPDGPAYGFLMGRHSVTVAEYVTFLNEVLTAPAYAGQEAVTVQASTGALYFSPLMSAETLLFEPAEGNDSGHFDYGIAYSLARTGVGPYTFSEGFADYPIVGVTWYGAVMYCNWLSWRKGLDRSEWCYAEGESAAEWRPANLTPGEWADGFSAAERDEWLADYPDGFRLPMDGGVGAAGAYNEFYKAAAWDPEAAANRAHGTGGRPHTWDDSDVSQGPVPVTSGLLNAYGLEHAIGNVWVWMTDPMTGGDLAQRAIRGWSWWNWLEDVDAAFRYGVPPHAACSDVGFRVVCGRDYLVEFQLDTAAGSFDYGDYRDYTYQSSGMQFSRAWYPDLSPDESYIWRVRAYYPSSSLPSSWYWCGAQDGLYQAGLDTLVYPQARTVSPPADGVAGIAGNLFFYDASMDGRFDPGSEALWRDGANQERQGVAGVYDPETDDVLVGSAPPAGAPGCQSGVYFQDTDGNSLHDLDEPVWVEAAYSSFSTRADGLQTVTLDVVAGWNLVSVPIYPLTVEVPPALVGDLSLWAWDGAERRYFQAQLFAPRVGYWLYAAAAGQITVRGYAVEDARVFVNAGWNLVGVIVPIADLDMTSLQRPIFGWLGNAYTPANAQPPYSLDLLKGYWIRAAAGAEAVELRERSQGEGAR